MTALIKVLDELLDGSQPQAGWLLNPGDPGLLKTLDKISAEEASAMPESGGSSIAAHVDHLRYGLELLNRWRQGEQPFADADYSASWQRTTVSEEEWSARRESLRREAYAWRKDFPELNGLSEFDQTGVVASVAHLAYHLGAIRQINRALRGPSAAD